MFVLLRGPRVLILFQNSREFSVDMFSISLHIDRLYCLSYFRNVLSNVFCASIISIIAIGI